MENLYQVPAESCSSSERRDFWLKVIADQQTSGMHTKEFCKRYQINPSNFRYWKYHKIRPTCIVSMPRKKQESKNVKFISVQVADNSQQKDNQDKIEIVFKNGHKIMLQLIVSEANLSMLMRVVGGARC